MGTLTACADQADQFDVEAVLGAVRIDGVEQDFADPALRGLTCPGDGVNAGPRAAAVRGHFKARRRGLGSGAGAAGVDGEHQDLRAEVPGNLVDDVRAGHGSRVDGGLVRAEAQELVHLGHAADAAADASAE